MKLISCNANRPLAQRIADRLDMRLTDTEVKTFKDREVFVKVNENVRGQDVYIIQSTSAPANLQVEARSTEGPSAPRTEPDSRDANREASLVAPAAESAQPGQNRSLGGVTAPHGSGEI